ncbi:MAG: CPBP family glutamic-type intramembrane protease [Sulfolobales archaeon]
MSPAVGYGSRFTWNPLVRIISFLSIVYSITFIYDCVIMKYLYDLNLIQLYQVLLTFRNVIPLMAVLLTLLMLREGIRDGLRGYGLRGCKFRFLLLSGLTPFLIYLIGFAYALILGFEVVNPLIPLYSAYSKSIPEGGETFLLILSLLSTLFVGSTLLCLLMLGQEVGWRGLLLEEAANISKNILLNNVLVGIAWGLWYSPLIILYSTYYPEHPDVVGVLMMVISCIPLSVVFSYLKLRFGSLLAPAAASGVLNGLHNLMVYTVVVGDSLYSMPSGLLGMASTSTLAVVLHLLWRRSYQSPF